MELSACQVEQLWASCGGKERACARKRRALELMLTDAPPGSQERDEVGAAVDESAMEHAKPRLTSGARVQLEKWLQIPAPSEH